MLPLETKIVTTNLMNINIKLGIIKSTKLKKIEWQILVTNSDICNNYDDKESNTKTIPKSHYL